MAIRDRTEQVRLAQRAVKISLVTTIVVVAVKLSAATLSHSISVLGEAFQSTLDILLSLMALLTLRYAAKPPDEEHPYGHGKAEILSSAFQMLVLLATSGFILWQAYQRILRPEEIHWGWGAVAMAYTAVSNTLVSLYLGRVGVATASPAVVAEAKHLQADTLTSLGVLVGVCLVGFTGWVLLDPIVAALFTIIAMIGAFRHLAHLIHPLMDGALPQAEIGLVEKVLKEHPEVRGYHNLRARQTGNQRFIELHVMLDDAMSFVSAHDTAEQIESEIRGALGGGVVSIHYEPYEAEMLHREREHLS